jgi:hypothetical protein
VSSESQLEAQARCPLGSTFLLSAPPAVQTPVYVPKPVPSKGKSHSHPLMRVAGAVAKAIEENDD